MTFARKVINTRAESFVIWGPWFFFLARNKMISDSVFLLVDEVTNSSIEGVWNLTIYPHVPSRNCLYLWEWRGERSRESSLHVYSQCDHSSCARGRCYYSWVTEEGNEVWEGPSDSKSHHTGHNCHSHSAPLAVLGSVQSTFHSHINHILPITQMRWAKYLSDGHMHDKWLSQDSESTWADSNLCHSQYPLWAPMGSGQAVAASSISGRSSTYWCLHNHSYLGDYFPW